ncbi:MAG: N-6 DNA methylase [Candidatus Micrarchaeia archaeon]
MAHSKEEAKSRLAEFIQRYQRHKSEGKLDKLVEENTKDYIDELFRILGWDIIDDVIKEYGTGKRKRVDYAFHLAGATKFLLEAKAYREDLEDRYVDQTLQYGYQNNKTWVVLTNLREIRIYNAKYFDQEEQIRQLFAPITLENALERFDDLWLLSKDAMEHGLINQVATKYGKIRPREAIDKKIFEDLMEWRSLLTKSISKNNKFEGTPEEAGERIDEAVQKILDRLIFVRVCEDRGLEEEEVLKWCIRQSKEDKKYDLMKYLNRLFSKLNGVYNSGLFASHFSENLKIDDETLEKVINHTYISPDGLKYDFSAIDADILGTVYEQYLGTLLKKTEKRATLKSEKAQRKKMGIYYTPTYIVDYIVKNTLGKKLKECKTPEEALKIKVLDPACGSGSFLIRAYDEFKRWFESYKAKSGKGGEQTVLSSDDKKGLQTFMDRVLENCIYGVDLDTKAVEIAQLNLLLKSAEDRHKLPKLDHTIQNGNSLVDDPAIAGRFAFKWEDKFPEVFRQGGFDVVIGNPPYINAIQLNKVVGENVKKFWKTKYETARGTYDIYILFFEQSLKVCREGGFVSFITPNKYLSAPYAVAFREWFCKLYTLNRILDLSKVQVFADPSVYPIISIFENKKAGQTYELLGERIFSENLADKTSYTVSSKWLTALPEHIWGVILSDNAALIGKIMKNSKSLESISIVQATSTAAEADEYSSYINETKSGMPIINTGTIDRYSTTYGSSSFMNKGTKLMKPTLDLSKVSETRKKIYQTPKIIISKLALRIEGFLDLDGSYASINTNCIYLKENNKDELEYLAGVINSKLLSFVYSELFSGLRMSGGYFQFQAPQLRVLPIANVTPAQKEKVGKAVARIVQLSEKINQSGVKSSNENQRLIAEIQKTDAEIDILVYDSYNLTEAEKKTIEKSIVQTEAER